MTTSREPSSAETSADLLRAELRAFAADLVRREPGSDVVERYVAAHAQLLPDPADPARSRDAAVLAFLRRHPRALGPLDAAAGLLRPRSLLRRKVLLATAILEATTTFAPEFLGRRASTVRLAASLAWLGLIAATRAAIGVPLLLFAERARP